MVARTARRRGRASRIGRALNAAAATVEYVGVDHRRLQLRVAEQFLDRADVVAVGEQVGGEAVTQTVEGRMLGDSGAVDGGLEGALDGTLVQVVPVLVAGLTSGEPAAGREDVLPAPLGRGAGVFRASAAGRSVRPKPASWSVWWVALTLRRCSCRAALIFDGSKVWRSGWGGSGGSGGVGPPERAGRSGTHRLLSTTPRAIIRPPPPKAPRGPGP